MASALMRWSGVLAAAAGACAAAIDVSGSLAGAQTFDGHGGLSAGASSRLLYDYPEPYRSQVLDYLFKPGFGASLHINKVEIGGDTQSTDGTEPSHRHFRAEAPHCGRGYESWLVAEAFKRNPAIETYILSWGVPNFIGNGSFFSADNIEYQVQFAECVRNITGRAVEQIGVWNERAAWGPGQKPGQYIVDLRNALDAANMSSTKIIVPDGGDCDGIVDAAASFPEFREAVYAFGRHYPCHNGCPGANELGWKFWSSEDQSTVFDWAGAGCWGRSLNQNFIRLNATATISWSTIWAVYDGLPYYGNGLMGAQEPWSGSYTVNPTIWTSAHWTQFVQPGWMLLTAAAGGGSGFLPGGGSYVGARAPNGKDFTLILETLQGECLRCSGETTTAQNLTFALSDGLPGPGTVFHVWQTTEFAQFVRLPDVTVAADGTLSVYIPEDAMVTLTTVAGGSKGNAGAIPASQPFPAVYSDDFEAGYVYDQLPRYFADQAGSFAVRNGVVQQVVPADPGPNGWVPNREPVSILGDVNWTSTNVSVSVSFNAGPADMGPGFDAAVAGAAPAVLAPCDPAATAGPHQVWTLGAAAPGYLSNTAASTSAGYNSTLCLNVNGCDAKQQLIVYDCVTTGGTCAGGNSYANLQWTLDAPRKAIVSALDGLCVAGEADGSLGLAQCSGAQEQVWTFPPSGSGQFSVTLPGSSAPLCLATVAPPPAPVYAQLCARLANFDTFGTGPLHGYCLRVNATGGWAVSANAASLAAGQLNGPFNSTQWHRLNFVAGPGAALTAVVDGVQVWGGVDASNTYPLGQVAIGSGYHYAAFDNFAVAASRS